jgi:hypothetical protein
MSFFELTAHDLRGGRHSWRVLSILWTVAGVAAVAARLLVHW